MRILFCKTGYMKYYKGINANDKLYNGGEYVQLTGDGGEQYNFSTVPFNQMEYCCGFVETKHKDGWRNTDSPNNQLHIEKIDPSAKDDTMIDDVLVVWCAVKPGIGLRVVGWYKNATVCRNYCTIIDDNDQNIGCNIFALKNDCVLLPHFEVNRFIWQAPAAKKQNFGFGQALVWFPNANIPEALINQILNYSGANYIDMYHEIDPKRIESIKI